MSVSIMLVFVVLLAAVVLLISERLRSDVVALLTLIVLALTGLVTPQEAFSGFSRSAVIAILSIYIITEGLERTGVTRAIGDRLLRLAGGSERRLLPVVMIAGAVLSLFMNNIAAGAVLLPAVVSLTRKTQIKPSKLLMPLAFATMLGGMATLLTTSNILVSNLLRDAGLEPFGLFDFAPVGIPIVVVGVLYMAVVGAPMLPNIDTAGSRTATPEQLAELYGLKHGMLQVYITSDSSMAGKTIAAGGWSYKLGLTVIGISRGGRIHLSPRPDMQVIEGDVVLCGGITDETELGYFGLLKTDDPTWTGELVSDEVDLVEVILAPRSEFADKTLKELAFRERYGLNVLSIWREGAAIRDALGDIPLKLGDALLVQGTHDQIKLLRTDANVIVLDEADQPVMQPRKGPLAALIVAAALVLATAEVIPIAEAFFAAAISLVVTGCLTMDEAYRSVEWRALFLISGFIPLGVALQNTGAADLVGQLLVGTVGQFGPAVLAGSLFVATALALQVLGNVGSAVIFAPIAISAAQELGADPRAFAMAVALGTSMAFLIPTAHPVNVMVMGPGGYRVRDFVRVGWGLTAALVLVVVIGLPLLWNL